MVFIFIFTNILGIWLFEGLIIITNLIELSLLIYWGFFHLNYFWSTPRVYFWTMLYCSYQLERAKDFFSWTWTSCSLSCASSPSWVFPCSSYCTCRRYLFLWVLEGQSNYLSYHSLSQFFSLLQGLYFSSSNLNYPLYFSSWRNSHQPICHGQASPSQTLLLH